MQHRNADALSRLPCRQSRYEAEREDAVCNAAKAIGIEEPCAKMNDLLDQNHDLRLVKSWIVKKKKPEYKEISGLGYVVRSLWSQWDNLILENCILYRKYTEKDGKSFCLQAVVPSKESRTVLQFCQDLETAAHLGVADSPEVLQRILKEVRHRKRRKNRKHQHQSMKSAWQRIQTSALVRM